MTESTKVSTICSENLGELAKQAGGPAWVEKLRLAAWQAYGETAVPTVKMDEWRKTLVETLELSSLVQLEPRSAEGKERARQSGKTQSRNFQAKLQSYFPKVAGAVYFVDGEFVELELNPELAERGLVFVELQEGLNKHEQLIKEYLSSGIKSGDGKLALMAAAFFKQGVFLYAPKNIHVEEPFLIVNLFSAEPANHAVFPRTVIAADEGSGINLINILASATSISSSVKTTDEAQTTGGASAGKSGKSKRHWFLTSALVDVYARGGSEINYLEIQHLSSGTFSSNRNYNQIDRDARFYSLTVGLGGGQLKSDIITLLTARGASADVFGVALGDLSEHLAYNTVQHHDAPDTKSNINFRVALKGSSASSYQGNIVVSLNGARTDAYQSNKNLLLSREAKAESIPRLEILTDDVKCSHGATVGPVDKNQVFYLMSRGLDEKEAEELIVSGFFNTVLSTCPIAGARDWIEDLVAEKIHGKSQVIDRG